MVWDRRSCLFFSAVIAGSALMLGAEGDPSDGGRVAIRPRARSAPAGLVTIRVESNLVLIPVTVTDLLDRPVSGLSRSDFRLFEDQVEQQIAHFSTEEGPVSVGLVLDASASMERKLGKARQAAVEFFKSAGPEDEFFLLAFNSRPDVPTRFTRSPEEIEARLGGVRARGRTALFDAIYLGIYELRKARNARRALLVLSDGGDNNSRYTESEIKRLVRESDVQIYAIGIFASRPRDPNRGSGGRILNELTAQTGGRHLPVSDIDELPDVAAKIGYELRHQYILGYCSSNRARDGKYRTVRLEVAPPPGAPRLRTAWRSGYYGPE